MGFSEAFNALYSATGQALEITKNVGFHVIKGVLPAQNTTNQLTLPPHLENLDLSKYITNCSPIVRLAALSGAMACVIGAYGAHTLPQKPNYEETKAMYEVANRYHFFHSLALLCVPMCTFRKTAASMLVMGMLLFCGTCYYETFTGKYQLKLLTPIGGTLLICSWLAMML